MCLVEEIQMNITAPTIYSKIPLVENFAHMWVSTKRRPKTQNEDPCKLTWLTHNRQGLGFVEKAALNYKTNTLNYNAL